MSRYKFQGLLHNKDGVITGAMSPLLAAKEFVKQWGIPLDGLVRVDNNQTFESGLDHLITKSFGTNGDVYCLFVDMGISILPVGMMTSSDKDLTITPVYLASITDKAMKAQRLHCEMSKHDGNPIMILNAKDIKQIFKEAEASGCFKIRNSNGS